MIKNLLFTIAALFTLTAFAQSPKKMIKKLGSEPMFFLDSVNVDKSELQQINPDNVAKVSVYKDSNAIRLVGPDGKDGVVYIETKGFDRKRYWTFFSSKSGEYLKIVPAPGSDTAIQYILNNRILTKNFEGDLALIDDSTFKNIKILDRPALESQYQISDKKYGVVIESDKPANLYHANKKF